MTTPPKARLHHIRRDESGVTPRSAHEPVEAKTTAKLAAQSAAASLFDNHEDGLPTPDTGPEPSAREIAAAAARAAREASAEGDAANAAPTAASEPTDMAARIKAVEEEGLSDRQLRLARRIAAMHEIEVESEAEAVVRLRDRGIDPFHRKSLGQIVARAGAESAGEPVRNNVMRIETAKLPANQVNTDGAPPLPSRALPSREAMTEERRAQEILKIQRDIARRRRIRLFWLTVRLTIFVFIPTLVAGWYYVFAATPLYEVKSQLQLLQADSPPSGGLGGLFAGTQLATNPESIAVQSYLTSRDAMMRLDNELGFKVAFQDPAIDSLLRLPENASNEEAFALYSDMVKISFDPTEGVINMRVIAPDPDLSLAYSRSLLDYAEGQVDQMTARMRADQMEGSREVYEEAENRVRDAQRKVMELQERLGVLDPEAEGGLLMGQIGTMQGQVTEKELELNQLLSNPNPNQSRVNGVRGDIARLNQMIAELRSQLTEGEMDKSSIASMTAELRFAEADLAVRQGLLVDAASQMEAARIEANKQVRYLSLSVPPVAPDAATYPKAFTNTLVAFLIFSGIYLMLSLTASILREQVSS